MINRVVASRVRVQIDQIVSRVSREQIDQIANRERQDQIENHFHLLQRFQSDLLLSVSSQSVCIAQRYLSLCRLNNEESQNVRSLVVLLRCVKQLNRKMHNSKKTEKQKSKPMV
jgi:hypothetical protein